MSINRPAFQLALRTIDLTVSLAYVTALDSTNQTLGRPETSNGCTASALER